jgi:GDPmannose 4,6-dehydratase
MKPNKTVIISGITGQDGAYLSKLLINKGYDVIGLVRSTSGTKVNGFKYLGIEDKLTLLPCDLMDISQIIAILVQYRPAEIYNLAAQSSVSLSFKQPIGTFQFNTMSVLNFLEAIRIVDKSIKFYQASSSEMFGKIAVLPITEDHTFNPQSPYAVSKASSHWACCNYRDSYGMFVVCGILFNHESYLRGENFFLKKVIVNSLKISNGLLDKLEVGNIDIKRDFGYAPEYVEAMYLMMQMEKPDNFLICTGKSVTLRQIIEYVFLKLSININKLYENPELYRPSDIDNIYGNPERAFSSLGWQSKMDIWQMIDLLIQLEIEANKN